MVLGVVGEEEDEAGLGHREDREEEADEVEEVDPAAAGRRDGGMGWRWRDGGMAGWRWRWWDEWWDETGWRDGGTAARCGAAHGR